jgi:hypothetical protein
MLLNDLINDLLPDGKYGNADPVTGQAAWFDLRINLYPAEPPEDSETAIRIKSVRPAPETVRFGEEFLPDSDWRRKKGNAK